MRPCKYTEHEILSWAECYLEDRPLSWVEKVTGVPDATIWWSFVHRLPSINYSLSERVMRLLLKNNKRLKKGGKIR